MSELEQLLSDLVAIDSVNPDLVPGGQGEAEIADYIANWLEQAGLETSLEEPIPHRPNVIGIARGKGGGKTLLLNGHIDTVGVMGMAQPHTPYIENGRLYGRGAYDMKCGVAACMIATAKARQQPLRGDVIFTAVMDEEYAGLGTMAIAQRYRADGAIIAEPTELQLAVAHKGFVWLEVETQGVAAHGSRPDLGVDAIAKMGRVLVELDHLAAKLSARPTHVLLENASVHASLIQGGRELSSYPDSCILSIERRTLPRETSETALSELLEIVERLSHTDPSFKGVARHTLERPPLETPVDSEIVQAVQKSARQVLKRPCELRGVPYWTDAATLSAAGIPSVLYGPSGAGAHATEEWVDLQSVRDCIDIYLEVILTFCS